jgi:hypothetical protein
MPIVSHQTIKLSRGKHRSPEEGACVMELASMLAGERFSDRPASVCPVIGSFLRAYNDSIDDFRRQDLYAYASRVVDSRSSKDVQRERAVRLSEWSREMSRRRPARFVRPHRLSRMGRAQAERIGIVAVRCIRHNTHLSHAAVLALVDELLSIGTGCRIRPVDEGFARSPFAATDETRLQKEGTR